ncbi:Putative TPR domain protein (AFU_orthologue; AFUA_3G00240) [Aspergillus calidoustus]|uniref:Putative TPR domain protein (AFU_orthologue AFUA_3G00240) n=1 Tax=Aspergillus calidoustus TaxID=454130 RepID=A0A0U4Z5E9_ASPCI|nr:Putative TPR domain protein (AFU_orthologue; AFUA_3G00240) [Aspergillus calidoustus]
MFAGKSKTALDTVSRMEVTLPEEVFQTKSPPMADCLGQFVLIRLHVLVRLGMEEELQRTALPVDQTLYAATTATTHYARGIAFDYIPSTEHVMGSLLD